MGENARLLLRLFWQPAGAMSGILDQGSLLFASIAVLAVSLLLQRAVDPLIPRVPVPAVRPDASPVQPGAEDEGSSLSRGIRILDFSFYTPLLLLAAAYVPGTLLAANLVGGLGSFRNVLGRDYTPLLTCTAMAWTAAALPPALAGLAGPVFAPRAFLGLTALCGLYFAILMFFAIRTVFGTDNKTSLGALALSVVPLGAGVFLLGPLSSVLGLLASPFFLFYAYYYLGGEIGNIGAGLRSRQNFRRMLDAAAVNPHDAEAQYQLGLVYQQRRQYTEAIERFKNAVRIDPGETDAHFQLGRIAREQGRLSDALACFQTVVNQNEKHSLSEILREIGAVYLAAKQFDHARQELSIYIERRPYDPEGLYYYGSTLEHLGDTAGAREMYSRSIEAVRTAPHFRRSLVARWSRLAQKQLGKLPR